MHFKDISTSSKMSAACSLCTSRYCSWSVCCLLEFGNDFGLLPDARFFGEGKFPSGQCNFIIASE